MSAATNTILCVIGASLAVSGIAVNRGSLALERIAAALEAVPPVCEITGMAGPMADTIGKAATPKKEQTK